MKKWLHIIGIGDDGLDSLSAASVSILRDADVIFGAARHHDLTADFSAQRRAWPSPFSTLIDDLKSLRGKSVAVLATGDPLWYSVGARLGREIDPAEIFYHPQLSAFQLTSARMGWSLADVETLTVHGRPVEQIIPFLAPYQRLIVLTKDASTPAAIASILRANGYGRALMTVLAHLGGKDEARFDGTATGWTHEVPDFHTLAIDLIPDENAALLPRTGLPDTAFETDGTMTKQDVRAITLARLAPMRGALLWDIGCGSGSVAIEWMRAARDARAIGVEARADRRGLAAQNAITLGVPALKIIDGKVPDALTGLPAPDAVFIGGGLSRESFDIAFDRLKPFGRLVINVVSLEGTHLLAQLHQEFGGELTQINIAKTRALGRLTTWKSNLPVTQLSLTKGGVPK